MIKIGLTYNSKIIFIQQIKQFSQKTLVILMATLLTLLESEAINLGYWLAPMILLFIFMISKKVKWQEALLAIKVLLLISNLTKRLQWFWVPQLIILCLCGMSDQINQYFDYWLILSQLLQLILIEILLW